MKITPESKRSRSAFVAAFASIAFFAFNPVFVSWLPVGYDFLTLLFWSLALATLFLSMFCLIVMPREARDFISELDAQGWLGVFITSLIRTLVSLCFFYAITNAGKMQATVLTLTWPLFFMLLSSAFDRHAASFIDYLLVTCGFVGAAIIIAGGEEAFSAGSFSNVGLWVALLAAFLGGVHSLMYKKVFLMIGAPTTLSSQIVMILLRSLFGVLLLATYITVGNHNFAQITFPSRFTEFALLCGLAVFSYAGTQIFYCYALVKMDPTELSGVQYFNPILVTFFLAVFIGESIDDYFLIGTVVIFVSQYFVQFKRSYVSPERLAIFLSLPVILAAYLFNTDGMQFANAETMRMDSLSPSLIMMLFAILTGFSIGQSIQRQDALDQSKLRMLSEFKYLMKYAQTGREVAALRSSCLCFLSLDWVHSRKKLHMHYVKVQALLSEHIDSLESKGNSDLQERGRMLLDEFNRWISIRLGGTPIGEKVVLWMLGVLIVLAYLATNDGGFFRDMFVIFVSSGILYVCSIVQNQDRSRCSRDRNAFLGLMNALESLGLPKYLPPNVVEEKSYPPIDEKFVVDSLDGDGIAITRMLVPTSITSRVLTWSLCAATIISVVAAFYLKY